VTTDADAAETPDAYEQLLEHVRKFSTVEDAAGLLQWDQQVMMPPGGTPARSRQLSTLSAVQHDLVTDDEVGDLLETLASSSLEPEQAAVVREVRREHERSVRVPTDLVQELSATSSEALSVWEEAKADDDFDSFAPVLERLVELRRAYADHIDPDREPYAVLFEDYEPCLPLEHAESILEEMKAALVPMIDAIRESDVDLAVDAFDGEFDPDTQEALSREALSMLGYDWDRGRLDTSSHPFTSGTQFDARVTTRFDPSAPLDALTATIHEFGHAAYQLGLPDDAYGTPLGDPRDLSVHESQSRLWENHVGRSQAWWELFTPAFREQFPAVEAAPREAYEAANQVYEDNLIRVEADELTYHLHVVVRFEIERALVAGDIDVEEVPAVWNDKYEQYLGIRPETDTEGCLQDIHWSHGNFGYFPTYSLGSAMAAQLYAAFEDDVGGYDDRIRAGEFDALHDWLGEHVHRHGKRYETNELVRQATGEDFSADAFVSYVRGKYGDLYDLVL
jgi:carboxypeptidase Taq